MPSLSLALLQELRVWVFYFYFIISSRSDSSTSMPFLGVANEGRTVKAPFSFSVLEGGVLVGCWVGFKGLIKGKGKEKRGSEKLDGSLNGGSFNGGLDDSTSFIDQSS